MQSDSTGIALVLTGVVFIAFILFKMFRPAVGGTAQRREVKRKIVEAKSRGRDKSADSKQRATAWREAALIALEDLRRPSLAASYARRAEKLDPGDADAIGILALSLRRAERFKALERFLWRRLAASDEQHTAAYDRAFQELVRLYEKPLHRPEVAAALSRLHKTS